MEYGHGVYRGDVDRQVDCGDRFLMPGLIDAHFHAYSPTFDILGNDRMSPPLLAAYARQILEGALQRGFTTVRDAGGGDIGLARAIERGLIRGPRFFYPGKALSQTGGHGDFRAADHEQPCACHAYSGSISVSVDGPEQVMKAAREQLRTGASQLKIFVSGGVASPTDPVWMRQFSDQEIRAAVREAHGRRSYVMAHSHTDEAARRCAELGVRTIEHGTMIDKDDTARLIAEKRAFVVPTLSVVDLMLKHAADLKHLMTQPEKLAFLKTVYRVMLESIERCRRAGVRLGLGTDLLGLDFHPHQCGELELRGEVEQPVDVLRSATSINAEIVQHSGLLGCIKPQAYADLIVVDGNPLQDLGVFRRPLETIPVIVKNGEIIRNRLS